MRYFPKSWVLIILIMIVALLGAWLFRGCILKNRISSGMVNPEIPCDTIMLDTYINNVVKDTLINITDTLYVNPGDTLGTDSVFIND